MKKAQKRSILISLELFIATSFIATSASQVFAGYGSSPVNAPVCNNAAPGQAKLISVSKSAASEIEIGWNAVNSATSWTLAYGIAPGKYIYGISDFGDSNSRSVKIGMLPAGTYYVAIKANNSCKPGPFSVEQKITISKNGNVSAIASTRSTVAAKNKNIIFIDSPSTKEAEPTMAVSGDTQTNTVPEVTTAPEHLNIFQRIYRLIFGK